MSADRTEKLIITRTHTATNVKVVIIENGVTASYTVKTYESQVRDAHAEARRGAQKLLNQVT